jgi:hypothetical protein
VKESTKTIAVEDVERAFALAEWAEKHGLPALVALFKIAQPPQPGATDAEDQIEWAKAYAAAGTAIAAHPDGC